MYKKIFVWIMIIGIACLTVGCGNQNSVEADIEGMSDGSGALYKQQKQSETQEKIEINWETGKIQGDEDINSTWGSSIQGNDQYFFYTAKEGIVRVDKETGVQTCILEWEKKKNDSVFLCLGTDRLCYVENAETVYSVDYFGGEKTEITSIERLEEAQTGVQYLRPFIYGMSVQNGRLYFTTEIGTFISDEDGKHIKFLIDRSKTSCFWKEYLICQNEVSEVYSYNLVSGEERTILGGNITEEEYQRGNYDRYQQPFVYQDNLYYIKNNKALYKYVQNGEDILLVTLLDNQYYMTGLCSSDGKVYYTYCEKNGEEFSGEYICEYKNGESSDAVLLQNDCNYISGIIGDTVFYKTESDDQFYKTFKMTDVR